MSQIETYYRPFISIGLLFLMMTWELFSPRRALQSSRSYRWSLNLSLSFINYFALKLIPIDLAYYAANWTTENQWGLLNIIEVPNYLKVILTILILDLMIYFQHRIFHEIPLFWRLHQVHHSDTDFDTTTAVRFHPLEILLSMFLKVIFIFIIGANPLGFFFFEVILNGGALFNHGNVSISEKWDRVLRLFIVTPDMHRIHHSTKVSETNSNYGFSIPLWDRLFHTYTDKPLDSHTAMSIGLDYLPSPLNYKIIKILNLPFNIEIKNHNN